MARAPHPVWHAGDRRYATIPRGRAWLAMALAAVLALVCLTAINSPGPQNQPGADQRGPEGQTDLMLYQAITDHLRAGEPYYQATSAALRQGGYPLRPFVTFRLPTLAVLQASLPDWGTQALLRLLIALTAIAWVVRLRPALTRWPPVALAAVAMAAGLFVNLQPGLGVFHEMWAGPLVALSLALRRPGDATAAIAVGLAAMLIRETALAYAGVMLILALCDGERREAAGWAVAIAVFGVVLAAHAYAVEQVTTALDPASPGWSGLQGIGFFVRLVEISTALDALPTWAAAIAVAGAIFGWSAWRDPLAVRALATIGVYAATISLFARSDNFYWGLMATPLILPGLVFLPDAVRDLYSAARERRRMTVRRLVP